MVPGSTGKAPGESFGTLLLGDWEYSPGLGTTEAGRVMKTGRRQSIPESAFADVRRWHGQGVGCRRIARLLEKRQVFTTSSSIHRLLKGLGCYAGRRVTVEHGSGGLAGNCCTA